MLDQVPEPGASGAPEGREGRDQVPLYVPVLRLPERGLLAPGRQGQDLEPFEIRAFPRERVLPGFRGPRISGARYFLLVYIVPYV